MGRRGAVKPKKATKPDYSPTDRLIMIVGNYGSGKTEVAVNLAIQLSEQGLLVQVADLDIVNPYFRCREARDLMEHHGIRVVVPPPAFTWADLPIVVPEIKGMLHPLEGRVSLFDVGGDDVGAKLLSSFVEPLGKQPYALWQVINSRRPFTDTVEGCLKMRDSIQAASRLQVTGLVVNSHLMEETTPEIVREGYQLARKIEEKSGLPVVFVAVMEALSKSPELADLEAPVLGLKRRMLPPWLRPQESYGDTAQNRPVPIGRP